MGSLVILLALSLRNGCLVLVEGEEVMEQIYNDIWIYVGLFSYVTVCSYFLFKAPFGD